MITINDYSKIISFDGLGLYDEDKAHLYIPSAVLRECRINSLSNTFIKVDNDFYYCKKPYDDKYILNELIGSYLARLINLESVDYRIGVYSDDIYMLYLRIFMIQVLNIFMLVIMKIIQVDF